MEWKRSIGWVVTIIAPATASLLVYLLMRRSSDIRGVFILLHLATLAWVIAFYRLRPCRVSVLPVSFLLAMVGPYLVDGANPMMFQYLGSAFMAFLYAIPWGLITLVASVVAVILDHKK